MKLRNTVSVVAAALGVVAGSAVLASSSAQAAPLVVSTWSCTSFSTIPSGLQGLSCYGSGSGYGWFNIYSQNEAPKQVYKCPGFEITASTPPYYTVVGSGCTPG